MAIVDKEIKMLNELSKKYAGFLFCPESLRESYIYVYPLAKRIGWEDEQITDALRFIKEKTQIPDERAGKTLRQIINMLCEPSLGRAEVLGKYWIKYDEINPHKNSFFKIIDIIAKCKIGAREIYHILNCTDTGLDFIDIVYSYRHEIYREE